MKKINQQFRPGRSASRLIALLFLLATVCQLSFAQMTIISGGKVVVAAGGYLNSTENMVINSGGNLDVQGTLNLQKNLQNGNAAANSLGSGTVLFAGAAAQTVSGLNVFQNMTLNNVNGLSLSNDQKVNGILSLSNGRITLGANNLLLSSTASVGGAPSAANMVVATGAGQLRKEYSAFVSFLFPVGDVTGVAEYSPVTVGFNSGTFGANNYVGVNLVDAAYPGVGASYTSRYWNIAQSAITNFSSNLNFQYLLADVVGVEASIFTTKVDPVLPWTAYNVANVATHTMDAHGLSSFGTFTGNIGNAAIPPAIRSLQDKIITPGAPQCADAVQTLIIAGNGTYYWVQNGGSVTHIAGSNIRYLPGTKVDAGGYMHGKISTIYCAPYVHPAPPSAPISGNGNGEEIFGTKDDFFKIYPNPTPGTFTLELKGDIDPNNVNVEILSVLGDRIQTTSNLNSRKQEFSITNRPSGIYMVHVNTPSGTQTRKIIKN